jgi:iron complex transport system ATP-binding protein
MLSAQALTIPGRLTGVTLSLDPGEVTAICGPNGAGKSTLLTSLAGLIPPASGAVSLDGRPLAQIGARDRACTIGYLPQDGEVAWNLSVAALVRLGRLPHRTDPLADNEAVDHALATLDLTAFATRPIHSLSGGERARALLARVLAGQPRWVLADEPLAALDLGHQQTLLSRFRELAANKGRAGEETGVVLVLHDLAHAMNHADRVIVLRDGMVTADGPPETALSEPVIAQTWGVTANWLGDPGARALIVTR